jgi:hypothetical protein
MPPRSAALRDYEWERLCRAWEAAGIGLPRGFANMSADSTREGGTWRNPGDHHDPQSFEEHTICSAQHAAFVLSRHPHSPFVSPARTRHSLSVSPARTRLSLSASSPSRPGLDRSRERRLGNAARGSPGGACRGKSSAGTAVASKDLKLFTPEDVIAWLDSLFERDDEDRRRQRHAAIRQAGRLHHPPQLSSALLSAL